MNKHQPARIDAISYNDVDQQSFYPISELQRKFFEKCVHLAYKSNLTRKHGCVIVKNNKIISCGYNFKLKNTLSNSYTDEKRTDYSVHAEICTIKKVKKQDLSKCELYVIRIGPLAYKLNCTDDVVKDLKASKPTYAYKYSCPCTRCAKTIESYGIKKVYYSINS